MDSDDDLSQISENSAGSRARSERGGPSNEDAEDAADETVSEQVVESNFRDVRTACFLKVHQTNSCCR